MERQLRVLIEETGDSFAMSLAQVFTKEGIWATVHQNPEKSMVQAVFDEHPDVVIMRHESDVHDFLVQVNKFTDVDVISFSKEYGIFCSSYGEDGVSTRFISHGSDKRMFLDYFFNRYLPDYGQLMDERSFGEEEYKVSRMLYRFGIGANLTGYYYLRCAILLMIHRSKYGKVCISELYDTIAKVYHSTSRRVERSIRHAVNIFNREYTEEAQLVFGEAGRNQITNSMFIANSAEWLRMHEKCFESREF